MWDRRSARQRRLAPGAGRERFTAVSSLWMWNDIHDVVDICLNEEVKAPALVHAGLPQSQTFIITSWRGERDGGGCEVIATTACRKRAGFAAILLHSFAPSGCCGP